MVFGYVNSPYRIVFGAETNGSENAILTSAIPNDWPGPGSNLHYDMITITRDGANTPLTYVDGVLMATTGTFINPAPSTNSLILGYGTFASGTFSYDGNMWEPQIWSIALSPQQVANLFFNQRIGYPWP